MIHSNSIRIYDTTLRDGSQAEDISFSVEDKLRIAKKLDEFGMHYIEGGWPGSNPKDLQFFQEIKSIPLSQAKIVAFGSTCRPGTLPPRDPNLQALIEAGTKVATIVGKSWDIHPLEALKISLDRRSRQTECALHYRLADRNRRIVGRPRGYASGHPRPS